MDAQPAADAAELQQALRSAECERDLERSQRIVEGVNKDEDLRKLRFQVLLLEDENDDLQDQLHGEEARSDGLETALDDALAELRAKDAELQRVANDLRVQAREAENMKAELASMETISTDSSKILTEKLALARELSTLKPELDHLRSQLAAQESLIAEKLSLQRQLNTLEVELESEKRATQRAIARSERRSEADAEHQAQIDQLQRELTAEKRAREKAEKETQKAQKELDAERKKAEKETQKAQRELDAERRATERAQAKEQKKAEQEAKDDAKVDELKKELAKEKREREKAEKAIQKSQMDAEAQVSLATERAEAYKIKLKTTKERLKEAQAELQKAQAAAVVKPSIEEAPKPTKNPRKRLASIDPDATTLGTPGDGPAAKRNRRTAPGDKSTFSITPFLNRTASVAPSSPIQEAAEEDEHEGDKTEDAVAAQATPTAPAKQAKKSTAPKPKPLAALSTNKTNAKPTSKRQKAAVPTLEKVAEEGVDEDEEDSENTPPEPVKEKENEKQRATKTKAITATATSLKPKVKPSSSRQPRKSLASFPTFNDDEAPEKKKKRKLGGGDNSVLGKPTLFDMDDEDARPVKPIPGRGIFAARALGKSMGLGNGVPKGGVLTTADGFTFSPLKKDKKAMREASIMG